MDDCGITIERIHCWVCTVDPYLGRGFRVAPKCLFRWDGLWLVLFTPLLPKSQIWYVIWSMMVHELICLGGHHICSKKTTIFTGLVYLKSHREQQLLHVLSFDHLYPKYGERSNKVSPWPIQLRLGGWYHSHSPLFNCQALGFRTTSPAQRHLKRICSLWMHVPYLCSWCREFPTQASSASRKRRIRICFFAAMVLWKMLPGTRRVMQKVQNAQQTQHGTHETTKNMNLRKKKWSDSCPKEVCPQKMAGIYTSMFPSIDMSFLG